MEQPLTKQALVERMMREHDRLEAVLATLSDDQMLQPGACGAWSVKDLLAHLMDWDLRFIDWYDAGRRGEPVHPPEEGYNWRQLDEVNRRIYEKHRDLPLVDVLAGYRSSYMAILAKVGQIPEEDLSVKSLYAWLGNGTLAGFIKADTFEHYDWARKQIKKWLAAGKSKGKVN